MPERFNDDLERLLPQSADVERAVLSAMLIENEAVSKAIEMDLSECFFRPEHSIIYRAITSLHDENQPVTQLTVTERIKQAGHLKTIGGEETISSLISEAASSANLPYHGKILKEKALLRKIIRVSTTIKNKSYDETANPEDIMGYLEESIVELTNFRQTQEYIPIKDIIHKAHDEIMTKSEKGESVTGVSTGYPRLNLLTSGWQPSDLIIVAGRPSMGKTAFALDLAKNAAKSDIPVAFFSLEMSAIQLVMRMLFNEARFDGSMLTQKKPSAGEWTRLSDACSRLHEYPIYIDETPGLSTSELTAKAKRLKKERNIGLIVIDYLQLMQGPSRESRQQEISSISRNIKTLAKELNVPIIALSQLSRALEQRTDHRPLLSDLRESGSLEQDADIVIFIYRASVYGEVNPDKYRIHDQEIPPEEVAEVIIRKQRNGPIGTVLLHWIKEYTKFSGEFTYDATEEYF